MLKDNNADSTKEERIEPIATAGNSNVKIDDDDKICELEVEQISQAHYSNEQLYNKSQHVIQHSENGINNYSSPDSRLGNKNYNMHFDCNYCWCKFCGRGFNNKQSLTKHHGLSLMCNILRGMMFWGCVKIL